MYGRYGHPLRAVGGYAGRHNLPTEPLPDVLWLEVQSHQQSGSELYQGQDGATEEADRGRVFVHTVDPKQTLAEFFLLLGKRTSPFPQTNPN